VRRFSRHLYRWLTTHRALLAVLLLALLLRLALWAQPLHEPANDEREYVTVAYDLLAGRGWIFYESYHWLRAPLYPLFLAGSLWLSGGDLHLAALPNVLLSVATVGLFYALTREITAQSPALHTYQKRAPLLAALLGALLLTLGTFASLYMSETLFSFLLAAAFLLLARWKRTTAPGRPRLLLVALAGVAYGLAVLTRSLPLLFLPVVLLWLLDGGLDQRRLRTKFAASAVFAVLALLTIAPWTLRNCQAYGQCILVETGFSYNMWAFNEPRESMNTIFATLEQIPNPAERADVATGRGMERLQEDPAILWRKLGPNWDYFWRIKPIQDRFLQATYYADPPPVVFLAALVFDDLLYAGILAASVVGLTWGIRRAAAVPLSPTVLLGLWVAYVVFASMLTHGEARYRHFVFLVLIPYAAVGLLALVRAARTLSHPAMPSRWGVVLWGGRLALIALLLHTVWQHYPWQWATRGAERSIHRLAGDMALARGNTDAAEAAYQRARVVDNTPDVYLALGDLWREQGDLDAAEEVYRLAWSEERHYIAVSARLGDLLREQGRTAEARDMFEGFYVSEQAVLDWSWAHLNPAPTRVLDVGSGLDFGYVGGMYPAEEVQGTPARWTNGRGLLRFGRNPAATDGATAANPYPAVLRLRLAAPRPNGEHITAQVCAGERCVPVPLTAAWRVVEVPLPSAAQTIELRSPTFTAEDGRELGVLIDRAVWQPPPVDESSALHSLARVCYNMPR
jgi:4-amino-4-deoxy-L-arabinose transferase-like glycosyltransferase